MHCTIAQLTHWHWLGTVWQAPSSWLSAAVSTNCFDRPYKEITEPRSTLLLSYAPCYFFDLWKQLLLLDGQEDEELWRGDGVPINANMRLRNSSGRRVASLTTLLSPTSSSLHGCPTR